MTEAHRYYFMLTFWASNFAIISIPCVCQRCYRPTICRCFMIDPAAS